MSLDSQVASLPYESSSLATLKGGRKTLRDLRLCYQFCMKECYIILPQ